MFINCIGLTCARSSHYFGRIGEKENCRWAEKISKCEVVTDVNNDGENNQADCWNDQDRDNVTKLITKTKRMMSKNFSKTEMPTTPTSVTSKTATTTIILSKATKLLWVMTNLGVPRQKRLRQQLQQLNWRQKRLIRQLYWIHQWQEQ